MRPRTGRWLLPAAGLALTLGVPCALSGQRAGAGTAVPFLPREEETRIALSAAPEHLRGEAGVYALTPAGFVRVRESRNGFTCVINRDHPMSRKPVCYDAEGTRAILPKVLFVGDALCRRVPLEEIERQVAAKFAGGEFTAPRRPGIAYMLTGEIRSYDPATGRTDSFAPHLMFYAPDLTDADIGTVRDAAARSAAPWLPFIGYQGPHGFIIVVVGEP